MRPFVFSKRHLVYKLAMGVFIVGMEMFAVGCFYKYWAVFDVVRADVKEVVMSAEYGLWEFCQRPSGNASIVTCTSPPATAWLTATQVLQLLAFVCYLLALVALLSQNWIFEEDSVYQDYRGFELFSFASSILVMTSFVTYMVNIKSEMVGIVEGMESKNSVRLYVDNYNTAAWCAVLDLVSSYITLTATFFIAFYTKHSEGPRRK